MKIDPSSHTGCDNMGEKDLIDVNVANGRQDGLDDVALYAKERDIFEL